MLCATEALNFKKVVKLNLTFVEQLLMFGSISCYLMPLVSFILTYNMQHFCI